VDRQRRTIAGKSSKFAKASAAPCTIISLRPNRFICAPAGSSCESWRFLIPRSWRSLSSTPASAWTFRADWCIRWRRSRTRSSTSSRHSISTVTRIASFAATDATGARSAGVLNRLQSFTDGEPNDAHAIAAIRQFNHRAVTPATARRSPTLSSQSCLKRRTSGCWKPICLVHSLLASCECSLGQS
jgi:hypothetical protein